MPDGDIARSRVAGLPISVNDTTGEQPTDTDWPDPDEGKPKDARPDSDPLIKLSRFPPNSGPLSPDVDEFVDSLKQSKAFAAIMDVLSALALLQNFV